MPVAVVGVGHMVVGMLQRFMVVPVAVFGGRHRMVHVGVVTVVMAVGVFVVKAFMPVIVVM